MSIEVYREFQDATLEVDGDGQSIHGICVPFDTPTQVADRDGSVPYMETWKRGAFRSILRDPGRVALTFGHDAGAFSNQIGRAVELRESDAGLEAVFRTWTGASDALEMIRVGTFRGLSVHAVIAADGTRHRRDGIVERIRVKALPHVALVAEPAFAGARVTAVREAADGDAIAAGIVEIRALQAEMRLRFPEHGRTVPPT